MQQKANTAKDAQTTEQILNLPVEQIRPFDNHPFQVNDDDELMQQTIDSIMQVGVLNPVIVRPMEDGGYQMVSGHRRLRACELAGIATIPAIARELNKLEKFQVRDWKIEADHRGRPAFGTFLLNQVTRCAMQF